MSMYVSDDVRNEIERLVFNVREAREESDIPGTISQTDILKKLLYRANKDKRLIKWLAQI